jgi:hypothetical protein
VRDRVGKKALTIVGYSCYAECEVILVEGEVGWKDMRDLRDLPGLYSKD